MAKKKEKPVPVAVVTIGPTRASVLMSDGSRAFVPKIKYEALGIESLPKTTNLEINAIRARDTEAAINRVFAEHGPLLREL